LIQASSSCATATGFFPFTDNLEWNTVAARRTHGSPSDPLGSPRQKPSLTGEDDALAPSDPVLIQRPSLFHTDSDLTAVDMRDPLCQQAPGAPAALLGRFAAFELVSAHLAFPPAQLIQISFNQFQMNFNTAQTLKFNRFKLA
jgi:hypothetical protein